jgi:RNA recognition motif-containing protein
MGAPPKRLRPEEKEEDMSKKLFVGSLSWNIDDRGLREAFAPHGEITEATVITDRDSGRSRGFGFVTFADDEAAEKAITALNNTGLDGRTIKVDVAQARNRDRDRGRPSSSRW